MKRDALLIRRAADLAERANALVTALRALDEVNPRNVNFSLEEIREAQRRVQTRVRTLERAERPHCHYCHGQAFIKVGGFACNGCFYRGGIGVVQATLTLARAVREAKDGDLAVRVNRKLAQLADAVATEVIK